MSHLYDDDFYAWTQQQAEAVRAGNWDAIDREHLAEEIEDWWKRESELLWHYLRELMVWLVTYAYAPQQRRAHPHGYVRIISIRVDIEVMVDIWSNLVPKVELRFCRGLCAWPQAGGRGDGPAAAGLSRHLPVDAGASADGTARWAAQSV